MPNKHGWKVDNITYESPRLPIKYPEQETIFGLEDCEHCKANREELLGLMDITIKTEFYSRVDYRKMATTQRVSEFQGNCRETGFIPHFHIATWKTIHTHFTLILTRVGQFFDCIINSGSTF